MTVVVCALALIASVLQPGQTRQEAEAAVAPRALPGAGPVDRAAPASATPDKPFAPGERPPVVPRGIFASSEPRELSAQEWLRVSSRGGDLQPVDTPVFTRLLLRPGYVLGDTSLLAYFNVDEDAPWTSWRVTLFDAESQTEQASTSLTRDDLRQSGCAAQRDYCRSFGASDGWDLDPAKRYFLTFTAVFPDREVPSVPTQRANPRRTILPPPIPDRQAAGCGCGNALGMTDARQAVRGVGVNTATGAFSRVEQDLAMASFGVPFVSTRIYSSANPANGLFGSGWAWSYGMQVAASDRGALVRADDGAIVEYRLADGRYQRPAGVRSTLRKTDAGWTLVTPEQISYDFDGQGRLTSIHNARQVGVRLAYTAQGVEITDASGRQAEARIEDGLIRRISLPDRRNVEFAYDRRSRLVAVEDARGHVWRYHYSAAGLLTEVVEPETDEGHDEDDGGVVAIRNEYSASGRVIRQVDAQGHRTTFAWNAVRQEAKTTDADGVVVYDGYHDNVLIHSQRGNGDVDNHRYDRKLNRSLVVNGRQNQNEAAFDARGNQTVGSAPLPMKFDQRTKYDERNNPIEFVDERGNKWKNTFNRFDELVESVDAEKHKIRYAYDERGLLLTRTDQRGKVTRYEYLPADDINAGLPAAIISPEGRRTEFSYDGTGRRIAVVDPRGTVEDADRDEFTTRFTFDDQDRIVDVREPGKRHSSRTEYDAVGRIVETETPTGVDTEYRYFADGPLRSVEDPRRKVSYAYSDAGRRTKTRVHLDDEPDIVTTYAYNAKGLLQSVTSPRGNAPGADRKDFTTTYRYDGNDSLVRISRPYPDGRVVHEDIKTDALDRTTSTVDAFSKTSAFRRDNTGNVTAATDTLGRTTRLTYDRNGRQTGLTDSGRNSTRFTYDAAGNKTSATTATGGKTTWTYDDDGFMVAMTEPRGNVDGADKERFTTHYEYDLAGNLAKVIDPLDHTTTFTYDANNRQTAVTDAKGNTTRYSYREDDQIRTAIAPDASHRRHLPSHGSTVYDYYDDGLLASVRDPNHHRTRLDYDEAGRVTSSTDPLGRRAEIGYDPENNPVSMITIGKHEELSDEERAERTIVDTYDIVGRRVKRTLGSDGPVYTWGYDAEDKITSYGDPTGRRNVNYDAEDQIQEVIREWAGGAEERFSYDYDARGNISSRTYPDGTRITADYDADSRITSLTSVDGAAGANPATWRFGYDVAGRRTSTTLPEATGLVERRSYDDAGRLTDIGTTRTPGSEPAPGVQDPVSKFALDLDEVGNPTRVVTTRGGVSESVAYDYDKADRVTSACYGAISCDGRSAGRIDYTYDLVGNRTSQKRTGSAGHDVTRYFYDAADQLQKQVKLAGPDIDAQLDIDALLELDLDDFGASLDIGALLGLDVDLGVHATGYDYDEQGNQIRAGKDTFAYNLDHSLAKATVDGQNAKFAYEATGLRVSATMGSGQNAATQRWAWDINGALPQIALDTVTGRDGQTLEKRGFSYGPDDEPLALLDPSTGAHSYTHDWLGGVATMLSPTGQVEAGYDYDPFGNPRDGPTLGGGEETEAAEGETGNRDKQGNDDGLLGGVLGGSSGGSSDRSGGSLLGGLLAGSSDKSSDGSDGGLLDGVLGSGPDRSASPTTSPTPTATKSKAGKSVAAAPKSKADTAAGPKNPLRFAGAYQDSSLGEGNYYLRARNYNPGTGRFTATDPMPDSLTAISSYAYVNNNPLSHTDPTGAMLAADGGGGGGGSSVETDPGTSPDEVNGPSPEELAKAQQIQSKSWVDVILEAGGQVLMEFLGINDLLNCLKGDIVGCVSLVVGMLPWGKIFKAKKIAEAIYRAGKAVITFSKEIKWARAIIKGSKNAAKAAKDAAAAAAKKAAQKAAAARAAAKRAAKEAAERAAAKAKALRSKAKKTGDNADGPSKAPPTRPGCNSFVAGTVVLLADGTRKRIEKVEPGDTIVATNPRTGKTAKRQVTQTIRTDHDKRFVDVTVRTAGGKHTITTTDHHPFWSKTSKRWIDAGDLRRGERLLTPGRGDVRVGGVREYAGTQITYDLTVNTTHAYYVLAGETPVLVHNCDTFPNQMGDQLDDELARADGLGVTPSRPGTSGFDEAVNSGTVKWAVLEDGNLVIQPKFVNGQEISHAVLSRGAPVRAAGEADIAGSSAGGYFGLDINPHSGHFLQGLPASASARSVQIGKEAFGMAGIVFP
ncbi:RHS repeat-associated core domain-containing protein [Actinopolymorpha sp. B11F2]|uniref:RHS repeat-associated core domain-containing protein n=1 Tax=Actinopolymorpha sp. B11F2 TaxID=3160862 RepID=UPI0032E4B0DA